jgi:hypothetical protein
MDLDRLHLVGLPPFSHINPRNGHSGCQHVLDEIRRVPASWVAIQHERRASEMADEEI